MKYEELKYPDNVAIRDEIANTVLQRLLEANDWRNAHPVYQEMTAEQLMLAADRQMTRTYSHRQKALLNDLFGVQEVYKYDSLTQEKVEAVTDWYSDMFVSSLSKVFTIKPTPEPTLDDATTQAIKDGVIQQLFERMQATGVTDPQMLLDEFGNPSQVLQGFLVNQAVALKKIYQNRILATAQDACDNIATKMRDIIVEGDFRKAFSEFTHDRFLYGLAVIRFPEWKRKRVLKHVGKKGKPRFEVVPTFRRVPLYDFFPSPDATLDLQNCIGVTERRAITKMDLIHLAAQPEYKEKIILDLLDEFQTRNRGWLPREVDFSHTGVDEYWGPDETITLLIHEGFFTGDDLKEMGIKGLKAQDYVSAHVEVCGGRTIRCQLLKTPGAPERTYFAAPFSIVGTTFWDCVGIAAKVADIEKRINFVLDAAMDNLDWSARPPLLVTPNAFDNPEDANRIAPGRMYKVNDQYAVTGNVPEPLRPMAPVSGQYSVLMGEIRALRSMADDASGVPAYAYGGQNMGDSSLGEFAQRMANALRVVKGAARKEDMYFTEPAFSVLFRYLIEENPDYAVGQDLQCEIRGMAGLLEQSAQKADLQQALPIALQGLQLGVVAPDVVKMIFRQSLKDMGVPIDLLDPDNDPLVNRAFDVAAGQVPPGATTMDQQAIQNQNQVPPLDGRSAAVMETGAMADPAGHTQQISGGSPS